jgi:hypothetical protein
VGKSTGNHAFPHKIYRGFLWEVKCLNMFEQTGSFAKQQWRFEPANMKVYPAKSRYLSKLDLLLIKTEIGLKWGFYLDVPATGWLQSLLGSGIAVQFRFLVPRKTNGISIYELSYNWCIVDLKVVISIEDLYQKVDFRPGHGILEYLSLVFLSADNSPGICRYSRGGATAMRNW